MRWLFDHRLVLAVGFFAAMPVIVSAVRAILDGWTPVYDDAIVATRSFDVLSAHSPLVGNLSDLTAPGVGRVYSPGPALFWLLAFQARFLGDWSLPSTMALVNTASIIGVVAIARRRGGRVFMFATAIAVAVMCGSLPQAQLHEIDNSRAAVIVFALLLFLAWSVACGEYRLLPVTALVASFTAQVHFSLTPPTFAVVVVALVGLAWSLARRRGTGAIEADEHYGRWLLGALVVALICWSGPLLDEAFNKPGNLTQIVHTATTNQTTVGLRIGLRALVSAIGIWPRWLHSYSTNYETRELHFSPNSVAVVSAGFLIAGLLVAALLGLHRKRRDVATGAALALVLAGVIVVVTASQPPGLAFRDYGLRWISPAGMFIWLALGWSLAVLLQPMRWKPVAALATLAAVRRPAFALIMGLAITALLAVLVATGPESDPQQWTYGPARTLASRLDGRLPRQRAVLVLSSQPGYAIQTAMIYRLRRWGYRVVAPSGMLAGPLPQRLGNYYEPVDSDGRQRYHDALVVDITNGPIPGAGRVIVRAPAHGVPRGIGADEPPAAMITATVYPPSLAPTDATCPGAPYPSMSRTTGLHVVPGRVSGFVDLAQRLGNAVRVCGWALDARDHRVADSVLLFSGTRFLGAVRPTISRPDVAQALGLDPNSALAFSGFSIQVPIADLQRNKPRLQLFATEGPIASPVPMSCSTTQDFAC